MIVRFTWLAGCTFVVSALVATTVIWISVRSPFGSTFNSFSCCGSVLCWPIQIEGWSNTGYYGLSPTALQAIPLSCVRQVFVPRFRVHLVESWLVEVLCMSAECFRCSMNPANSNLCRFLSNHCGFIFKLLAQSCFARWWGVDLPPNCTGGQTILIGSLGSCSFEADLGLPGWLPTEWGWTQHGLIQFDCLIAKLITRAARWSLLLILELPFTAAKNAS